MGCGASTALPPTLPTRSPLAVLRNVRSEYEIGTLLGDGAHAKVWNGSHRFSKQPVAIKEMNTHVQHNCNFHEELRILDSVKGNEHIVELLSAFSNGTRGWLVMPVLVGGDVQSYFFEKGLVEGDETEVCVAQVMAGLFSALDHCHNLGVAHLDVKPENILLRDNSRPLHAVLTDFGSARVYQAQDAPDYNPHTAILGTPCYVAPDVIRKSYHPPQADMWSAGMTMLTLLTGDLLFDSPLTEIILHRVSTTKIVLPPTVTKKTSTACRNLLQQLLRRRGHLRPTSRAACEHPWIQTRGSCLDTMEVLPPDEPEEISIKAGASTTKGATLEPVDATTKGSQASPHTNNGGLRVPGTTTTTTTTTNTTTSAAHLLTPAAASHASSTPSTVHVDRAEIFIF